MSRGPLIFAGMTGAMIIGTVLISLNWARIDAVNEAFAIECNEIGGVAGHHNGILQCLKVKEAKP